MAVQRHTNRVRAAAAHGPTHAEQVLLHASVLALTLLVVAIRVAG